MRGAVCCSLSLLWLWPWGLPMWLRVSSNIQARWAICSLRCPHVSDLCGARA